MRRPAPHDPPVAMTIAGSDSGGGAGIQADLKTMEARGAFGTSAVTAVTAQHTRGVESTHVLPLEEIRAQIDAVREDFAVGAAKTGMLATSEVIETVAEHAREAPFPFVVDPVMVAASGDRLLAREAERTYEDLLAEARVVTPNADEAEILADLAIDDEEDAREAGHRLVEIGADAALVKGGHVDPDADRVRDVLVLGEDATPDSKGEPVVETITHPRIDTNATHGSGCTLSAGIAARLAAGDDLQDAVRDEIDAMARALRYPLDVGEGPGAVHHMAGVRNAAAGRETSEAVEAVLAALVEAGNAVRPLVPEVGMNVCGATPFAERPDETVAVEGRITRTMGGIAPNRGVRFDASGHLSRFLIAAREYHPDLRFAVNCRHDDGTREALDALDWETASYDRRDQPSEVRREEGNTMQWGARVALGDREAPPVAVTDPGAEGKEPMCKVLATDAEALRERVFALAEARPE